jgi:predicted ATPase
MRITDITVKGNLPINHFSISELESVVLIAGPNGIGKTRLIQGVIQYLREVQVNPNIQINIEATSNEEKVAWNGKSVLHGSDQNDMNYLRQTLHQNRSRRNFKSSILYYESNRQITNVKPMQFAWEYADPWEEKLGWDYSFNTLASRFQDTLHSIFKKVQSQKTAIANRAIQLRESGHTSMNLNFEDPLVPFKEVFYQLLSPKTLKGINNQGNSLQINTDLGEITEQNLSSGEREVLNIAFDFLLRQPSDCVIFFDEPELHLHPELTNKLLNTLKNIGENNQFIFCTHSAELISSNLDNSVVFIQPSVGTGENQAVKISLEDETYDLLKTIGQSIGVVSLGKKIVLIEGQKSSLDKKTYMQIIRGKYPSLVLVPCEGKYTIQSFGSIANTILQKTVWGIDFFLLSDRDSFPEEIRDKIIERNLETKIQCLDKYHLENYFLDEKVIVKIFEDMEPAESWLRDEARINERLKNIASGKIAYATALSVSKLIRDSVGNVDIMPKGIENADIDTLITRFQEKRVLEDQRIMGQMDGVLLDQKVHEYYEKYSLSLSSDLWKDNVPGKQIIKIFSSQVGIGEDRFKTLYIKKAFEIESLGGYNPFHKIVEIFEKFNS